MAASEGDSSTSIGACVRLRPPYTFAGPFRGRRAEVCTGCVETRLDGGEHTAMTGGRWAVIDRRGHEVAPTSPGHSTP